MAVHHTGAIRDLIGITMSNEIIIELELERMILPNTKKQNDVFTDVCKRNEKRISMKDIKMELLRRYEKE